MYVCTDIVEELEGIEAQASQTTTESGMQGVKGGVGGRYIRRRHPVESYRMRGRGRGGGGEEGQKGVDSLL